MSGSQPWQWLCRGGAVSAGDQVLAGPGDIYSVVSPPLFNHRLHATYLDSGGAHTLSSSHPNEAILVSDGDE